MERELGWVAMAEAYNRAIQTLNTRANAYLNETYASSARSIGSVPNNPNSETNEYYTFKSSSSPSIKKEDTNYEADYNQMNSLSITNIGSKYWLASRQLHLNGTVRLFSCYCIEENGAIAIPSDANMVESEGTMLIKIVNQSFIGWSWMNAQARTFGLRPVFTLKPNIKIKGEGTFDSPYNLFVE